MLSWKPAESRTASDPEPDTAVEELRQEIARLRKMLRRHGHAQELFQGRVEEQIQRLAGRPDPARPEVEDRRPAVARQETPSPTAPQLRTLVELDQAVRHLVELASATSSPPGVRPPGVRPSGPEDLPRTLREGLDMLHIRIDNLQRSFGLEAIPARGRAFDDRCHRVHGLCHRPDLPDGQVAEELLPGYRLGGKVVRPALVIVNRWPPPERRQQED